MCSLSDCRYRRYHLAAAVAAAGHVHTLREEEGQEASTWTQEAVQHSNSPAEDWASVYPAAV